MVDDVNYQNVCATVSRATRVTDETQNLRTAVFVNDIFSVFVKRIATEHTRTQTARG